MNKVNGQPALLLPPVVGQTLNHSGEMTGFWPRDPGLKTTSLILMNKNSNSKGGATHCRNGSIHSISSLGMPFTAETRQTFLVGQTDFGRSFYQGCPHLSEEAKINQAFS